MDERPLEPATRLNVFVADDDDDMRDLVATTLRFDGHCVVEATDGVQLLHALGLGMAGQISPADVVITDVMMPRLSGLGVLKALSRSPRRPPIVLMTVLADRSVHVVAKRLGAAGVLFKPFDAPALRSVLANLRVRSDATQLRHSG
jgi:CheY-like chemotaxis protein